MSEPKEIDHEYTRNVVCPYCGHEHDDCHEHFGREFQWEEESEVDCHSCEKTFKASREFSVTFSTEKIEQEPRK